MPCLEQENCVRRSTDVHFLWDWEEMVTLACVLQAEVLVLEAWEQDGCDDDA